MIPIFFRLNHPHSIIVEVVGKSFAKIVPITRCHFRLAENQYEFVIAAIRSFWNDTQEHRTKNYKIKELFQSNHHFFMSNSFEIEFFAPNFFSKYSLISLIIFSMI